MRLACPDPDVCLWLAMLCPFQLRELLETMGGPRTLNAKEREELLRHADPDRDGRIYVDDLYA